MAVGMVTVFAPVEYESMDVMFVLSNVTVWGMPSRLVNVTVAPGETWMSAGLKRLPCRLKMRHNGQFSESCKSRQQM